MEQILKFALNQAGIYIFNNCVVYLFVFIAERKLFWDV